jgi:hypothetical protein
LTSAGLGRIVLAVANKVAMTTSASDVISDEGIAPNGATAATNATAETGVEATRRSGATLATGKVPLGEELPVFCEKCGYSLHGMPQTVCAHCTVRQFHCPECGHHQPINTLRPAFQKTLGRVRAFFLALSLLVKLNFFGWLLFAWVMVGYEMSYEYRVDQTYSTRVATPPNAAPGGVFAQRNSRPAIGPREFEMENVVGMGLFALAFGAVGRMLLLRWRRGYLVGLSLAGLVCGALVLGAYWRKWSGSDDVALPSPWTGDYVGVLATTGVTLILGAVVVWGVWSALAHVFLPRRTSDALLDWQRSLSNPAAAQLARE